PQTQHRPLGGSHANRHHPRRHPRAAPLRAPHRHRTQNAPRPHAPRGPHPPHGRPRPGATRARSPVRAPQHQRQVPAPHPLPHQPRTPPPHPPAPRRALRHGRHPMRRPIPHTALLLVALTIGTTHAQMPRITGIAYAYASITILFGDGHAPSFELAASVYPRAEINQFCVPGARCASGMASSLGYAYAARVFTRNAEYHAEESTHIRQWEALGPGFLLAYGLTGGEPFEPYHTRNSVIASAS